MIKKFIKSPLRVLSLIVSLQCFISLILILYFTFFVTYLVLLFLIPWFAWFGLIGFSIYLPRESLTTRNYIIFFKGYPEAVRTWWKLLWIDYN